jgi:predicted nicotinamide N-methyase
MNYPIHLIELEKGFSLYLPDELFVKKTYERLSEIDEGTPFPFWAKTWPSSIALIQFLIENSNWIQGKRLLELGAGIGQPSLKMAHLAKEVIISDYNKDAVELMKKNITHLALTNVQAIQLDWNKMDYAIQADTILLSDINYDAFEFESLLQVIEYYIDKGTTIIIATPLRMMGAPFIESVQKYIQSIYEKTIVEFDSLVEVHVYVLNK